MRILTRLALGAIVMIAFQAESSAETVWLKRMAPQTQAGQDFDWTFNDICVAHPDFDAWFTIKARGDYNHYTEKILWDIEGILDGRAGPNQGGTVLRKYGSNDWLWKKTYRISGSTMNQITSDGKLNITLDLTSAVNILTRYSFVKVQFDYKKAPRQQVPEPAALALVGIGAIVVIRRKKKLSAVS